MFWFFYRLFTLHREFLLRLVSEFLSLVVTVVLMTITAETYHRLALAYAGAPELAQVYVRVGVVAAYVTLRYSFILGPDFVVWCVEYIRKHSSKGGS